MSFLSQDIWSKTLDLVASATKIGMVVVLSFNFEELCVLCRISCSVLQISLL